MFLLTGGSSGSSVLDSAELLNVNGEVGEDDGCDVPNLPKPRKNHMTFVTKDSQTPVLATCGGSTSATGFYQTTIVNSVN